MTQRQEPQGKPDGERNVSTNPFAGRSKQVVIRTKSEAEQALREHRKEAHGTDDLEEFFDCAACGILERRLENALDVQP